MKRMVLAVLVVVAPLGAAPVNLRCEYLVDPIGIDVLQPRFSWVLDEPARGQRQTAYQVVVSTDPQAARADMWDSGRVASPESTHVVYAGTPLGSERTYYWKVRYWDKDGRPSPYSRVAWFEMGLLEPADWRAQWIGGANQLRREFTLERAVVRARAYIAGVGYYELRINGRKAGDHVLDPGWTTYDKRVLYVTYDVTTLLRQGPNAVGVMLGQGWFGARALLLQIQVELEGGTKVQIASDATWKAHAGPIVSDSLYDGEVYDARLETPGWDQPGFADATWKPAAPVTPPKGVLSAQMMPPIRVVETLVPLKLTSPRPGVYVFDLEQNISGWVELRVRGPRGTAVRLRHAELVYDDGRINVENLRAARATDTYILRGDGEEEIYEPRFTYHGFRYVEVTGFSGTPRLDSVRGRVVHSDVRPVGGFSAPKPILNRLHRASWWGIKTNLHSVPTDCPQRDERIGWMGDAHLAGEAAMLNFDMAAFYTNFLHDIRDEQSADGAVTDTVPHKWGRRPADPAWGSAYPLLAWYTYQHYGDRRILEEHYEGIKKWADFLRNRSQDGILSYSYYGDWVATEKTPGELVSTFYYFYSVQVVARVAEVLGRTADAEAYRKQADAIQAAFHTRFFRGDVYGTGSQAAQTLALYLNLAPKEARGSAWSHLVNDIVYGRNTHLTTGIHATKYLMELLARQGRAELTYELATQTTYPSWGYMLENGATTIWELWQNKTGPAMNSHNHPAFASVDGWLYRALAGLNVDPSGPGWQRIRVEPQVVRDLEWASGSIESMRGPVACAWRRTEDGMNLAVTIPAGSEAEIHVPKPPPGPVVIREGGRVVWRDGAFQPGVEGLTGARDAQRAVIFLAGSGRYTFEASSNP